MTSNIDVPVFTEVSLPATGTTGSITFSPPAFYRAGVFVGNGVIGSIRKATETGTISGTFAGRTVTLTDHGDGTCTLTGLAWYDYPYIIIPTL